MIKKILKLGGFTNEADFYKKYPTEASFMAEHGHKLKTDSRTLNPYISLFTLEGLKAEPTFMPDIEEVPDTTLDTNLKFNTNNSGATDKNKNKDKFDVSSASGVVSSAGSTIDADMDKKNIDERGFQDVGKAGVSGGLRAGAKGAAAGFQIGSLVPIPGANLVGAAAGFIGGATYGAIKDTNQAKDDNKDLARKYSNYYAGLPKMTSANPYKMEMGGSKLLNEYNGATHENGGIALTTNIEVEDREVTPPITSSLKDYVFSNSLLVPGKKTTIATAVKREIYPYKNRENDPYAKRAMEQIYEKYKNINEMQKAVAEKKQAHAQELEEIQRKFGGYKLIKGGKKSIGILPDMENDNSFVDYNVGEGSLPNMYKQAYLPKSEQVPNMNFGPETGRNKPETDPYRLGNAEDYFPEGSDKDNSTTDNAKKKSKFGNEEMALGLSMLPGIYNVAKGWKPDSTNFQNMNPNLVNLESEREGLRREAGKARLIANENVRQIGGGSGSALAALATQSSAINDSKMKGLSDSYQREHLANVTTLNDFLVRNTGIINEEYVANEQNKAMSDSLKGLGLSDLSNNGQGYLRDKELNRENKRSNDLKMNVINQLFANYEWGVDPDKDDQMRILFKESLGGSLGVGAYTGTSNKATKSNAKGTTTTTSTSSNTKSGATTKKTTTTKKG